MPDAVLGMPTEAQKRFCWKAVGYEPSPEQLAMHLSPARIRLVVGGERAGKSYSAAMELFANVIGKAGKWWIVAPTYDLARPEGDYVLAALQKIGAVQEVSKPRVGSFRIETVFGGLIISRTSDDTRKLAGEAPDGVLLCEAAQTDWEVFLKIRGRVAERRGFILASGTLESGANWYTETFERWQADNPEGGRSFSIPTWANLKVFPGGRDNPELKALEATLPADVFMERYGAVPCPPAGLVFREFSYEQHVREMVWRLEVKAGQAAGWRQDALALDPRKSPIEIAVDPGYAGGYAVLAVTWQNDQVFVFDEVAETGLVAEDIIARCKERWWWKHVKGGVIDVAGTQHPGSKSQQEIWRSAAGIYLRTNRVGVVEGILRLRTFLVNPATKQPRIWFAPKCKETLTEFRKYRYLKSAENRPVSELPLDRDNHCMKALSYWLYDRFGPVERKLKQPQPGSNPFGDYQPVARRRTTLLPGGERGSVRFGFERAQPKAKPPLSFEVAHE